VQGQEAVHVEGLVGRMLDGHGGQGAAAGAQHEGGHGEEEGAAHAAHVVQRQVHCSTVQYSAGGWCVWCVVGDDRGRG